MCPASTLLNPACPFPSPSCRRACCRAWVPASAELARVAPGAVAALAELAAVVPAGSHATLAVRLEELAAALVEPAAVAPAGSHAAPADAARVAALRPEVRRLPGAGRPHGAAVAARSAR